MKKEDREKLLCTVKDLASSLHRIWVDVVRLDPDDAALQSAVKAAWDQVGHLGHALVSEPDKADDGGRRCSFCGSQTEIPF